MEPLIPLPLSVLAELLASHSQMAFATYTSNPGYCEEHFSFKAEELVLKTLEDSGHLEQVLTRISEILPPQP